MESSANDQDTSLDDHPMAPAVVAQALGLRVRKGVPPSTEPIPAKPIDAVGKILG